MSLSRPVFAVAVALLAAAPATAVAQTPSPATLELSAAGKRALKPSKVTLSSGKLAVSKATVGSSATLDLSGTLRFRSGKRTVGATRLRLTIGRSSSYVSARLGKKTVRLLSVTPTRPASLDAGRGAVTLTGARIALTKPAAKALRTALKLKRTPSTAALGKLSVSVAPAAAPAPAPLPQPAPSPTPAPTVAPTPTPEPGTPDPIHPCVAPVTTPALTLDWFGCQLPGSGDLKSWRNYLHVPFAPLEGCPAGAGSITATGGATQIAGSDLDHRFPIATFDVRPDGSATITAGGTVTYRMPTHGIEESIGTLKIEIDAGGRSATVYADGVFKPRDMSGGVCATAPSPYTGQPVLTLDLTRATKVTSAGVERWIQAPATIAAGNTRFGGGTYPPGTAWGAFTIALPQR